ncbi:MAG: hypothetical protein JWO82_2626 [Akkermansiaceae bacterium]|nr:hypothetical protein [Akkermansiaceae bacterium]
MSRKLSKPRLAAWRGLLTVQAQVVAKIERRLAAEGLPALMWYDVLFALHEAAGKRLRMSELADEVLLSRSGLTRLVDKLEAGDYLRRENCATDKRGLEVVLTEKGTQVLREVWPVYSSGISEWFSDSLSDGEVAELTRILDKILHAE